MLAADSVNCRLELYPGTTTNDSSEVLICIAYDPYYQSVSVAGSYLSLLNKEAKLEADGEK